MKRLGFVRIVLAAFVVFLLLVVGYKGGERASDQRRIRRAAQASPPNDTTPPELIHDPAGGYDEDYVAAPGTWGTAHGSSIVELADHSLLCAWYAGQRESGPDVKIYSSRFDPKAKTWSAPAAVAGYGERAEWSFFDTRSVGNPTLYRDDDGIVWMFYAAIQHGGWNGARVDYRTSPDSGASWSQPKTLIHLISNLPRNKPIRLAPNEFMIPLYQNFGQKHGYTCTVTVSDGRITSKRCASMSGDKHTQPALVRASDDQLFAYTRSPAKQFLMFTQFDFAHESWSRVERLDIPNPNSAVDVVLTPDRKILLVYNDSHRERLPLSLAVSSDGRIFKKIHDVEDARRGSWFSYPAMIRAADGTYHITYSDRDRDTIKHVQFSQAWLEEKIRAAP